MRVVIRDGRARVRMLVLAAIAALLSGCMAAEQRSGSMTPPSGVELVALEDVHDFGTVDSGPVVTHTFKLKNYGPDTIEIKSVKSACGCTAILASTPQLGPGEEGGVEVALDTYKLTGEQSKTITVKSSDPVRPELPMTLHGFVATDLRAAPARLYLGHLPAGAVVSQHFDVKLARPDVQITAVTTESARFSLETTPLDPPEHGVRVRVTLLPTATTGTFDDRIVVASTSERQPKITIPVLGAIERQEVYARRRAEKTASR
jgi:hypothetical protein